ncbi:hypothetical protein D3C85_835150 [compost metagenome]
MFRRNGVDEHVLGRNHDDLAQGKYQHRQAPGQQRPGQGKAQQAGQEHGHARQQPREQPAATDASADQVLQGNHRHGVGRHDVADHPVGVLGRAGHHQILGQKRRELAEHHGAEHSTQGKADQAVILEQQTAHGHEGHLLYTGKARLWRAVAPTVVGHAYGGPQGSRSHKRPMAIELEQPCAHEGADGVSHIAQGVFDGEHFTAAVFR